jgi:hypothetical protein
MVGVGKFVNVHGKRLKVTAVHHSGKHIVFTLSDDSKAYDLTDEFLDKNQGMEEFRDHRPEFKPRMLFDEPEIERLPKPYDDYEE